MSQLLIDNHNHGFVNFTVGCTEGEFDNEQNGLSQMPDKMDRCITKWTDAQQNGQMPNKMDTQMVEQMDRCLTKWTSM